MIQTVPDQRRKEKFNRVREVKSKNRRNLRSVYDMREDWDLKSDTGECRSCGRKQ